MSLHDSDPKNPVNFFMKKKCKLQLSFNVEAQIWKHFVVVYLSRGPCACTMWVWWRVGIEGTVYAGNVGTASRNQF